MSSLTHSKLPCPNCTSSDAYHLYDDGHGWCFSCSKGTWPDGREYKEMNGEYSYAYLPWRGISTEAMEFFDVATKVDVDNNPIALAFPYPGGGFKVRSLKEKKFYAEGTMAGPDLFGRDKFPGGSSKGITITEGEGDALAHYTIFGPGFPVTSVKGSSSAKRDCAAHREYLNSFDKVYLAFDADGPGQDATKEVAQLFDFNKVYHVKLDQYKDALGFLEAGAANEYKRLWWNAGRFLPEGIYSSYATIFNILNGSENKRGVPYPFRTLNTLTQGIRTGESVLLTAQEGVGKTEVLRAVEYTVATTTDWPIGIIHLEEMKDRNIKGLIGQHLNLPVHLEDCNVSQEDMERAYRELSRTDDRIHFYSHFGSDDPDVILDTIRFLVSAAGCRLVTLDHINMVVSGLHGEKEVTKALDYLSTRLEMMVKELDFALVYVAHVNDDGKTRDSRMIAKVCDIRIDMNRDIVSTNEVLRNTTYLNVSKNRPISRTGPAGRLIFDPQTFKVSEVSEELPK